MNKNNTRPTIAVDLDETLVHVTPIPPKDLNIDSYFTFVLKRRKFYVQMRPDLIYFLEKMSQIFNICVFTASEASYANKIIDKILPNVAKNSRFFRDSCTNMNGYLVKDLNLINCSLEQTLLIDDNAGSALKNPKNLIKIKPWNGEKDDDTLKYLIEVLEKIAYDDDIRISYIETIKQGNFDGFGTF